MVTVIGVKFYNTNKIYFFDPKGVEFNAGDGVIVETARGTEYGLIAQANHSVEDDKIVAPLKPIIRKAGSDDIKRQEENIKKSKWALGIADEKIKKHNLDMKLVSAEYTFDQSKVIISFTAEGRVDFRELVKDLASVLKVRIELRQIYERDDIKTRGALASCGRICCCNAFLADFEKVSIKMAKNQGMSLNPQKISGVCGKLMCCLKYENDYYAEINKKMPKIGATVLTPDGKGEVESVNILQCTINAKVKNNEDALVIKTYPLDNITPLSKGTMADSVNNDIPDELKNLEN